MALRHSERFYESVPAGFDGLFEWDFLKGAFPRTSIEPMDHDCVVEINGHFLLFETKDDGVEIKEGQRRTLEARAKSGSDTVVILWGKRISDPKKWKWFRRLGTNGNLHFSPVRPASNLLIRDFCKTWGALADAGVSETKLALGLLAWDADNSRWNAEMAVRAGPNFVADFIMGKL